MSDIEVIKEMINNTIITPRQKEALQNILEENEDLQNDYDSLDESYKELEDKINDLKNNLADKSSFVDLQKLIERMKIDNIYTSELDDWLDNYFKFYDK